MADTATMPTVGEALQPEAPLAVDERGRVAAWRGCVLDLSPTEFDVLAYLHRHAGVAVAHDELLRAVWHATFAQGGSAAQVRSTVKRLRQKVDIVTGGACRIASVRGVGYRLELAPAGTGARPFWAAHRRLLLIAVGLAVLLAAAWVYWQHLPGNPRTLVWYRGRQVPIGVLWASKRGQHCVEAPNGGLYCFDTPEERAAAMESLLSGMDPAETQPLRGSGAGPDLH